MEFKHRLNDFNEIVKIALSVILESFPGCDDKVFIVKVPETKVKHPASSLRQYPLNGKCPLVYKLTLSPVGSTKN